MQDHRMVTINHQPVPEWDWPGMTMNFTFAEGVDIADLKRGQAIEFEMQKNAQRSVWIVDFKADDSVLASEVWLTGDISMLMADFGMLTLNHLPVAEWSWEAGEMNFSVGADVDLSGFEEGQKVRFLVEKQGSDYQLKNLKR